MYMKSGSNLIDAIAVATAYMFLLDAVVAMLITALRSSQLFVSLKSSSIFSSYFCGNKCKPFLKGQGHTKSWQDY